MSSFAQHVSLVAKVLCSQHRINKINQAFSLFFRNSQVISNDLDDRDTEATMGICKVPGKGISKEGIFVIGLEG